MYYGYGSAGNQLLKVKDSGDKTKGFVDGANTGPDYSYDANGNMNHDLNKSIGTSTIDDTHNISYNHLNLPIQVTKNTNEKIIYTYDASGRKLKQDVYNASGTKTTDYDGEFIYQGDTLQFINHEEGRIVMKSGANEYQYHLKDHLGNVRVTFTTSPAVDANTGTYETANANTEQSKFVRYANINATIFDHTNGNSIGYSERLNGSANERYGLARSISVMPGDVINAEVYAKYVDPSSSNWTTALNTLMGQIASNTSGVVVDGTSYTTSTSSFPTFTGVPGKSTDTGGPKAYLNWLIFDRNYNLILSGTGYQQMSTVAKEAGSDVPHEYLASPTITIKQPGYVYIYLSNEEPTTSMEVYFDDFKVTQTKSPLVQQEDFYPFGLAFNSYSREKTVPQNYLYNSKEQINDLAIDWYDYGARMYMPEIGRWGVIDPMSEAARRWTPYRYAFDNPMRFIDPDGMYEYSNGYGTSNSETETGSVEHYGTFNNTENGNEVTTVTRAPTKTANGNAWSELDPTAAGETFETGLTQDETNGGGPGDGDSFLGLWWHNFKAIWTADGDGATTEEIEAHRKAHPEFYAKMELASMLVPIPGAAFGKLGKVVTNPGLKITSISTHAMNQAITRGVTSPTILSIVRNPLVVLQQGSGNFLYLSKSGAAVLTAEGKLVTTYGSQFFDDTIKGIVGWFK